MSYFPHKSHGYVKFDPRKGYKEFDPWWAILACDKGIVDLYCWFSKKYGRPLMPNKLWGPHISFIKGEHSPTPEYARLWGRNFGRIEFNYSNIIRYDNGLHAW